MSTSVFPSFAGLAWSVYKAPVWSTLAKKTVSGRELRLSNYSYPVYRFKLSYEVLRAATAFHELQDLIGFFNSMQGSFDTFLYKDPSDYIATSELIGVGDGVNKVFHLSRTVGGYTEPVVAPDPAHCSVTVGSTSGVSKTLDANTGTVTLAVAPSAGVNVYWTGEFYYRCRFHDDILDLENFMFELWTAKTVQFVSVKL